MSDPAPTNSSPEGKAVQRTASTLGKFFEPEAPIEKSQRDLPHWNQAGCIYFVTYRMGDSIPAEKLHELERERFLWLKQHPKPWNDATWTEYSKRFEGPVQQWLDAGHGSCVLRADELRDVVVESFHRFAGARYDLGDYVIMPNHAHVLVTPMEGFALKSILHTWKSFTAKAILKVCPEAPGHFWQHESYDHIVRSPKQLAHYQHYIRENPLNARLKEGSYTHWVAPKK